MPNPGKTASDEYLAFAEDFAATHLDVVSGSMFGMKCLKHNSKAFAGGFADGLVVKLADADRDTAAALDGAEVFDPSGKGHAMKNWIVLGPALHEHWDFYADAAFHAIG